MFQCIVDNAARAFSYKTKTVNESNVNNGKDLTASNPISTKPETALSHSGSGVGPEKFEIITFE